MKEVTRSRRESQGGYALLMIFLMAAIIALMLYQQLPRVAFESEREKEQLLIDRGEQYTRAIQLYYLANNRTYPSSIDDLEKREKRFLRRRFVDPFTGKDEWRIVHTNGGFLTDSLVQKPPAVGGAQSAGNTTTGGTSSASNTNSTTNSGTNGTNEPVQVNAAVLQRPSDRPVTPTAFGQTAFPQDPSGQQQLNTPLPPITLQPQQGQTPLPPITLQSGNVNQPGGLPPITLTPIGAAGGQQMPGQVPAQTQGQVPGQVRNAQGAIPTPGQTQGLPGAIPGVPPGFIVDSNGQLIPNPNTPTAGQVSFPGQTQGVQGQNPGFPGQPFTPQAPGAGGQVQGSPSAALTAINQLLTTPRQTNTAPTSTTSSGNQIGAIAGIASTHKGPSIKVYKDQQKYELWEFVFNPNASTLPGGGTGIPAVPGAGLGQPGGQSAPSTFAPSGSFGSSGGGQQSPFGAIQGR